MTPSACTKTSISAGQPLVSIVRFQEAGASVARAVELVDGLAAMPRGAKVFIKPNIVFWTKATPFPKWGVITTSRVVEDMVVLLKDHGAGEIVIGEGMVALDPRDKETPAHAFEYLGYNRLRKRFGIKAVNVLARPFVPVDLGGGGQLRFSQDAMGSDLVVNLPVLKTHAQTVVSLGIKNLKGLIDIKSRKVCHGPDPEKDLHWHVARLADAMPPMLTLIDGIYSCERGPGFDGRMHRADVLAASRDVLSVDMVGAGLLGFAPDQVPYLVHAAGNRGRACDLGGVRVLGEPLTELARHHEWDFPYVQGDALPAALARQGVEGLVYRKYDSTMCTFCSLLNGVILTSISRAWQGDAWDKVEVLTGKMMQPSPGMSKTILLGKCIYAAQKDNPAIKEMIAIKGCPPNPGDIAAALNRAGIPVEEVLFNNLQALPGLFLSRYEGRPEFEEAHFQPSPGG